MTQDKIEQAVVAYIMAHGKKPKFVLLDEKSYEAFNKSFVPIERVAIYNERGEPDHKVKKFNTSAPCELEILEVKSDKELFEVVA